MGIVHWLKQVLEPKWTRSSPSPQSLLPPQPSSTSPTDISLVENTAPSTVAVAVPSAVLPSATVSTVPQSSAQPISQGVWVPAVETVQIGSYRLSGLIYVGDCLAGVSSHVNMEPCLIRPQLKLDEAKPDLTGNWISQWPSYSEIPSASRAAYLEWLANGRVHPQTPIGYVYLFFYGLERRVLKDLRQARRAILPELRIIMAEVERLRTIYEEQAAFADEANCFLEICRLLVPEQITALAPPWTFEPQVPPLSIEVALGAVATAQIPLPADWALAWAMHQSPSKLRTPASRCFPEWRYWFHQQYEQAFGPGLLLEPAEDQWLPTTATYQPASVSFGGPFKLSLPDIPRIKQPDVSLAQILPLLEAGTQALDLYSRWVGRNPDHQGSYEAILLLPPNLMSEFATPTINAFRQWVEDCLAASEIAVVSGQDLLQQWQEHPTEKLTKTEATVLSQYLARVGIGMEPDVQMGGKPLNATLPVVLFRLLDDPPLEPSKKYTVATVLLHLSVLVAIADDDITPAEQQRLQDYLASTPHLQGSERVRLHAHLQGLLASKLSTRGLKLKLRPFSLERKKAIAQFLIHLAAVDGDINPAEIAILSKLYPLLGLDSQTVFSHIHDLTVGTNIPSASPSRLSPSPPAPPPSPSPRSTDAIGLQLNRDLIDAKVNESATVSALLADVFVDDEDTKGSSPANEPESTLGVAGLDLAHSQFLQRLSQQSEWPRHELEPVVAELGLLLDGALEIVNEAAFEQCDEPLAEGEDPIDINADVLQELLDATPS